MGLASTNSRDQEPWDDEGVIKVKDEDDLRERPGSRGT